MTATPPIEQLSSENDLLKNKVTALNNEINSLKEQLAWFQRQVFGKRSEKIVKDLDDSVQLFPGFEEYLEKQKEQSEKIEEKQVASHKRRVRKNTGKDKISIPEDLPVERIELDLPEEEKTCSETGLPLVKIGEETSRKLAHVPESFYVKEYVRPIYATPKGSQETIRTAPLPDSIIPKCRADESFLAEIITKKYADHLPLYRISEALTRIDVQISRQLLSQWVNRIGLELKPLYDLMLDRILKSENIFIDETPISMLAPGKGKVHQAFMWVIAGGKERDPPNRVYGFKTNRKHGCVRELIGDYSGFLHSDKYGGYEKLAIQKQFEWCPCFSHIRRKFFEVESGDLKFRDWCLRKIRHLFMLERVAWNRSPEERLKIRREKEISIIDELIFTVKNKLLEGKLLPKSKLKQALGYFCSLIPFLKNYVANPWAHIDNNIAERAVRPLAIGRKNWLFVGNEEAGIASGVLLSLVQTCRALKINPREYLEDVLRRIMSHPYNKLEELLPENWVRANFFQNGVF
ncbi:MAG: IS66 family transposase [Waddliaceae bacterium]